MILDAFERMVALRYLRARRQEGFISLIAIFSFLGIALGVAALIITMSVMNGFTTDLLGRILGLGGHIAIESSQGTLADFDTLAQAVRRLPGVTAAQPIIEGQALATTKGRATGATVRGLREADLAAQGGIAAHLAAGGLERFGSDGVLIGGRLASALGVRAGDSVTLTTPAAGGGAMALPHARSFPVAGVFSVNIPEYDSGFIFMPLAVAQGFFAMPGAVTSIEVFVVDPERVGQYEDEIRAALGDNVHLSSWQENNAALFGALRVERSVMFIILSLIVLVAAFNIVCSMIMLVKDKGQYIAILRTMGATRGAISRIFMLSGASIGVVGTLAGLALGVAGAANIKRVQAFAESVLGRGAVSDSLAYFSQVPALIDPVEVAVVIAIAFGLSFLATVYPSWRAARLDPVEALRYE